jgi:hypothetical protein
VAIDDSGGFDETLALAFAGGALAAAAGGVAVGRMSRHVRTPASPALTRRAGSVPPVEPLARRDVMRGVVA